jgi:hypothetical protein
MATEGEVSIRSIVKPCASMIASVQPSRQAASNSVGLGEAAACVGYRHWEGVWQVARRVPTVPGFGGQTAVPIRLLPSSIIQPKCRQRGSRLGSCDVDREAQARRCGYDSQSSAANLHHETDGSERIEHEDRVLSRGRISACVHKRHSQQSRAGMPDKGLGVSRIRLEHLE